MALPFTIGKATERLADAQRQAGKLNTSTRYTPLLGIAPPAVGKAMDDDGLFFQVGEIPLLGDAIESIPLVGETLGAIPIGFNTGKALGLEGTEGFIADLLLDPFNFLSGVGFLKGAKSAKAAARIMGRQQADRLSGMIQAGIPLDEVLRRYRATAERAAQFDTDGFQALQKILQFEDNPRRALGEIQRYKKAEKANGTFNLPNASDLTRVEKFLARGEMDEAGKFIGKMIGDRRKVLEKARKITDEADGKEVLNLMRDIRQLHPSQRHKLIFGEDNLAGLKLLYKRKQAGLETPRLPAGRYDDNVRSRQAALQFPGAARGSGSTRNVLEVGIPLTNMKFPLIVGQPLWRGIDALDNLGKGSLRKVSSETLKSGLDIPHREIDEALRAVGKANPYTVGNAFKAGARLAMGSPDHVDDVNDLADIRIAELASGIQGARVARGEYDSWVTELAKQHYRDGIGGKERRLGRRKEFINKQIIRMIDNPGKFFKNWNAKAQRRALQEGRAGSRFDGLELSSKAVGVTPEMVEVAGHLDAHLVRLGNELRNNALIEDVIEEYFPRITKVIKKDEWEKATGNMKVGSEANAFYRFGMTRTIPGFDNLLRMEKEGIIEVEKDVGKILEQYIEATSRAFSDSKMVKRAMRMRVNVDSLDGRAMPAVIPVQKYKKLKKYKAIRDSGEYVRDDSKDFTRAGFRDGAKVVRPFEAGAYVHKSVRRQLKNLLDKGIDTAGDPMGTTLEKMGFRASDTFPEASLRSALILNSLKKRSMLSFSAFHMIALTESAMASVGLRDGFKLWWHASGFQSPVTREGFLQNPLGGVGKFNRYHPAADLIDDASKAGLNFGTLERDDIALFNQVAESMFDRLKGVRLVGPAGHVAQATLDGVKSWDTMMWQNTFSGLKMGAWHELYLRGLKNSPGMSRDVIARAAADHVNNAIGGLNWEKFLVGSKTGQQFMRLLLLAPDWTTANLRIAWDVFANMLYRGANTWGGIVQRMTPQFQSGAVGFGDLAKVEEVRAGTKGFWKTITGRGRIQLGDILVADQRAQFARRYAFNAALMGIVGANMVNHAMTGHFMEDNPQGRRDVIKLSKTENLYWDLGKQFKEPFKWLESPTEALRFKKSAALTDGIAIFGGVDMFGREIVATEGGPLDEVAQLGGHMLSGFAPISVRNLMKSGLQYDDPKIAAMAALGAPIRFGTPPPTEFEGGGGSPPQSLTGGSLTVPGGIMTQSFRRDLSRASQPLPF